MASAALALGFLPRAASASQQMKLPEGAVTVVAQVHALGGKEEELAKVSQKLVPAVRSEPGCLLFQAHRGANTPGIILFYEIFATQEAFEAHKNAAHTKQWFKNIESLVASPVEVSVLAPIS